MKFLPTFILCFGVFVNPKLAAKNADDASTIIKKAEAIRTIEQAKSQVSVVTIDNKTKTKYEMDVLQGSSRKAYLEFTSPKVEVGRRMLAIKTKYWSKFPDSRRVVSISRKEAIGNSAFAIADVFQMDVDEDYQAKTLGKELVDGKKCFKIEMNAKSSDAPYHKIIYFVDENGFQPIKAEFYAVSGVLLKVMTVEKRAKILGVMRPSVVKMVDSVSKGKISWWHTRSSRASKVRDEVFTKAYLKGR